MTRSISMITARAYHGLDFTIAHSEGNRICYVILPEGLKGDGISMIESAALRYGCTVAVITGTDWNSDLTPWAASGVFRKEKPFEGRAGAFLNDLFSDFFPGIEQALGIRKPERYLVGVSLSGLFAVWSLWRTDRFKAIASISGSLWYDGFTGWAQASPVLNSNVRVHLSLGDREKNSRNQRMAVVEDATATVAHILKESGCDVDLRIVRGTHFSPIVPHLEMALESILSDGKESV